MPKTISGKRSREGSVLGGVYKIIKKVIREGNFYYEVQVEGSSGNVKVLIREGDLRLLSSEAIDKFEEELQEKEMKLKTRSKGPRKKRAGPASVVDYSDILDVRPKPSVLKRKRRGRKAKRGRGNVTRSPIKTKNGKELRSESAKAFKELKEVSDEDLHRREKQWNIVIQEMKEKRLEKEQGMLATTSFQSLENERAPGLPVEQFTTKLRLDGRIIGLDTSGLSPNWAQFLKKEQIVNIKLLQELAHNIDLTKLNSHLRDTCQTGHSTSPVYSMNFGEAVVTVQTRFEISNFYPNMEPDFIMATHTIIQNKDDNPVLPPSNQLHSDPEMIKRIPPIPPPKKRKFSGMIEDLEPSTNNTAAVVGWGGAMRDSDQNQPDSNDRNDNSRGGESSMDPTPGPSGGPPMHYFVPRVDGGDGWLCPPPTDPTSVDCILITAVEGADGKIGSVTTYSRTSGYEAEYLAPQTPGGDSEHSSNYSPYQQGSPAGELVSERGSELVLWGSGRGSDHDDPTSFGSGMIHSVPIPVGYAPSPINYNCPMTISGIKGVSSPERQPLAPPRYENKKDKFPNYMEHLPPEDDPLATRTVFAGNLEAHITVDTLWKIFEIYGTIEEVKIKTPPPGTGNAYAFVRFVNLDMASRAKSELSGQYIGKLQCKMGYGKLQPTTKVWIGGLCDCTTPSQLEREFGRFGSIKKMEWMKGVPYAYILFETTDAAHAAVKDMRGRSFCCGKRIRTDFADATSPPIGSHLYNPPGMLTGSGGGEREGGKVAGSNGM